MVVLDEAEGVNNIIGSNFPHNRRVMTTKMVRELKLRQRNQLQRVWRRVWTMQRSVSFVRRKSSIPLFPLATIALVTFVH